VLAPISEEVYFRGMVYTYFRGKLGAVGGLALSSILFASAHLDPASFIEVAVLGGCLAWLFEKTRSLNTAILAHFTVNFLNFVLAFAGVL